MRGSALALLMTAACSSEPQVDSPGSADPCAPEEPFLSTLPDYRSLYLPENFKIYVQAAGAASADIEIETNGGEAVGSDRLSPLAPGIFMLDPHQLDCATGCLLRFSRSDAVERAGGAVHPFGGRHEVVSSFDAGLSVEVLARCERNILVRAHLQAADYESLGPGLPQSSPLLHVLELQAVDGEWTPVGGTLGYASSPDLISFEAKLSDREGESCFSAVSYDSAGNRAEDRERVCLEL